MAPQTNWSTVLLDPRSNFTVFVPSEAGFRANAGEGQHGGWAGLVCVDRCCRRQLARVLSLI